jgi:hypothetical protein
VGGTVGKECDGMAMGESRGKDRGDLFVRWDRRDEVMSCFL